MLRYLVQVTEDLLAAALVLGLLWARVSLTDPDRGQRTLAWGAGLGTAAAALMAYMKNTTAKVNTGTWNLRIFTVCLLALAVYLAVTLPPLRKARWSAAAARYSAAVLAFLYLFYALPNDLAYPFTFSLNGESVFSTAYLYRLIGWVLGFVLMLLLFSAVRASARRMGVHTAGRLLNTVLLINAVQQAAKGVQILLARRAIPSSRALFQFARYTSNYSDWFLYAAMLLALPMAVVLWVRSYRAREPYENPAQHRKLRAAWRSARRWSALMACCFLAAVLNLTVVDAYNNRPVQLSPVEESEVRGENVYVSLEPLEDGHLHRFAYTTEGGVDVRFIVVKKPGASSYGVGLDACDICGETGYYERSGQVICKLCDVVMNINTIGFKGGCNPIVLDYSVEGGYIVIPVSALVENEKEFK